MHKLIFTLATLFLFSCSSDSTETSEETKAALRFHQSISDVTHEVGTQSKDLDQQIASITMKAKSGELGSTDIVGFKNMITEVSSSIDQSIENHDTIKEFDKDIPLKKGSIKRLERHKKLINNEYLVYLDMLINKPSELESAEVHDHLTNMFEALVTNNESIYTTQKEFAQKYKFKLGQNRDKEFESYHQQIELMKNNQSE